MKKIKVLVLMLILVTLLDGCGNTSNEASENTQAATTSSKNETASEEAGLNESEDQNTLENAGSNVLIAYFSRIGNIDSEHEIDAVSSASVVTQGENILGNMEYMAELIRDVTGGDIHFIETSKQYPSEYDSSDNNELDVYVNKENRENARPELATHVENMDDYDVVFLGFPNWYGDMPMAVYSFLDEYDLSGKKIYLFNSSGGGGPRDAYSKTSGLEPDAEVEKNIFSVSHSQVAQLTDQDMQDWLSEIGYGN
ncbi:MAG: flavodoxin [Lachnospiraceae bacterium]|nr:flavodoxin [Lachnospiraceae bacterium]MDD3615191.1 flavodoxin [Lachnospiraceae bacterium]